MTSSNGNGQNGDAFPKSRNDKTPIFPGFASHYEWLPQRQMAGARFESSPSNIEETAILDSGDVKSDVIPSDPAKLADVLQALASLSDAERQALRKLLE